MTRKRTISREEESLWRQVTGDMEALAPAAPPEAEAPAETGAPEKTNARRRKSEAKPPASPPPPTAPPPPDAKRQPELVPGKSAGLDKRKAQRLKRGQLRPEARIDLHGMIQSRAHAELNGFVAQSHGAGLRTVLVITGKGSVRDGGVLRRMVPRWLNQAPLRAMVLAIEQAVPRDGGAGAYYLLLRRRR